MLGGRSYAIRELEELTGFDRRTIVYYIQQELLPRAGRRGPNTRYPYECLLRLRFIRALKDLQDQGHTGTITLREIRHLITALDATAIQALLERGPAAAEIEPLLAGEREKAAAPPLEPPSAVGTAPPAGAASPLQTAPTAAAVAAPPVTRPPTTGPTGERRSYGLADANIRRRFGGVPPATPPPGSGPAPETAQPDSRPAIPPPVAASAPAQGQESLGDLLRELEIRPTLSGRRLMPGASEHWTEIPITSRVFLSVRGLSADDAPLADSVARELKKLLRSR
jgi:DNA-binding transcriptional MerR regulator